MRLRKKTAEIRYSKKRETFNKTSNWNWNDFVKDTNWFATVCNLPSAPGGLIPIEIPHTLVSMKKLKKCFTVSSWGFKLNPSRIIPVAELKEIVEIVDGPENVKRNRLRNSIAKGIYADRILGLSVNWALYAHHKHKEQLQRAWSSGQPPPRDHTLVRVPIWYTRPPPLPLNAIDGFTLKETPIGSGSPADGATGCSMSIEITGCNLDPKVTYSRGSLKTDSAGDTQRCFNKPYPVERRGTSRNHEPGHTPVIDNEDSAQNFKADTPWKNTENLRTEARTETVANQSLLSIVTPERIQLEISSLTRQQKKLQDDISILKSILEMVSRKDREQGTHEGESWIL